MRARSAHLLLTISLFLLQSACGDSPAEPDQGIEPGTKLEVVLGPDARTNVGSVARPVVRLTDRNGKPVAGETLSFTVIGEHGWVMPVGGQTLAKLAKVETDADGRAVVEWTLGLRPVRNILAVQGTLSSVSIEATPSPGAPYLLKSYSGDGQRGKRNSVLAMPLQAQAVDKYDNRVPGAHVQFTVIAGDGEIAGRTAVTDSLGVATSGLWLLGDNIEPQKVEATSGDVRVTFGAESFDCSLAASEAACTNVGELTFVGFYDNQIYSVQSNGTSLRRLTGGEKNSRPVWSADGQRLAFISESPWEPSTRIMLMNADGSDVQVRTSSGYKSVSWSPDGKFLAVSNEGYYESSIDVISVDPTAGVVRHLSGMARGPAWSPDGKQILYTRVSGDDGYDQLFVMNADGSGHRALTVVDRGFIVSSSWAPDGRRVAFAKCLDECELYTIDVDGSNQKQLTDHASVAGVDWSPNGKWIAISSLGPPEYSIKVPSLFYIPADGGALQLVALNASMPVWRR